MDCVNIFLYILLLMTVSEKIASKYIEDWPFLVLINYEGQKSNVKKSCVGSLIARRWVATAGHCVFGEIPFYPFKAKEVTISIVANISIFRVHRGIRSDVKKYHVEKIVFKEKKSDPKVYYWNPKIALLYLKKEVPKDIKLARLSDNIKTDGSSLTDAKCTLGAGSDANHEMKMKFVTRDQKNSVEGVFEWKRAKEVYECIEYAGTPLTCLHNGRKVLVGMSIIGDHCGYWNGIMAFTDIESYFGWISDNISNVDKIL